MVTTDDRWTCPECGRTFVLGEPGPEPNTGLAALQAGHAKEHAGGQAARQAGTGQRGAGT